MASPSYIILRRYNDPIVASGVQNGAHVRHELDDSFALSQPQRMREEHPCTLEVNLGIGTTNCERWSPVVDQSILDLSGFDFDGRSLNVRENVKFNGGQLGKWLYETFPSRVSAIGIEFKKIFINEWSSVADLEQFDLMLEALESTLPGVRQELCNLAKASSKRLIDCIANFVSPNASRTTFRCACCVASIPRIT